MYICKAYRGISVIVVLVKERLGVRLLQKGTRHKAQGQLKSVFDCVHFVLLFTRDRTTRAIIQRDVRLLSERRMVRITGYIRYAGGI